MYIYIYIECIHTWISGIFGQSRQMIPMSHRLSSSQGDPVSGGDSRAVHDKLTDIQGIQSTPASFVGRTSRFCVRAPGLSIAACGFWRIWSMSCCIMTECLKFGYTCDSECSKGWNGCQHPHATCLKLKIKSATASLGTCFLEASKYKSLDVETHGP